MNNWINVKTDQFIDFRVSYQEIDYNISVLPSTTFSPVHPEKPTIISKYDPLQQFTRNIKKGIKAFSKLKDSKQWDFWYLTTKAHAHIRYLSEVLDPIYIPTSPLDKILFNEKNVFMYTVFAEFLLTDTCKSLVGPYELRWDI